jgi:uncharacterized protein YpuA (DUF1002 family)
MSYSIVVGEHEIKVNQLMTEVIREHFPQALEDKVLTRDQVRVICRGMTIALNDAMNKQMPATVRMEFLSHNFDTVNILKYWYQMNEEKELYMA